jgi:hypothetical protein
LKLTGSGRLAQQVDERITEARVRDAPGREKKLQDASRFEWEPQWPCVTDFVDEHWDEAEGDLVTS